MLPFFRIIDKHSDLHFPFNLFSHINPLFKDTKSDLILRLIPIRIFISNEKSRTLN